MAYTLAALVYPGSIGELAGPLLGFHPSPYRTWHVTGTMVPLDNPGTSPPYGRAQRGGSAPGNSPDLPAGLAAPLKGCFSDPGGSANWVRPFLTDSIADCPTFRRMRSRPGSPGAAMLFPPNAVWAEPLQTLLLGVVTCTEYWIPVFSEIRAILPDENCSAITYAL